MDFGRTTHLDAIDYTLPTNHIGIEKVLGGKKHNAPKVYIGGVLWSDEGFVGTIYPDKAKATNYSKYYTRQFNTIELNSSHYRIPEIQKVQKWYEEAPSDFRFCPKIPQAVSHSRNLSESLDFLNEFHTVFKALQHKFGTCFLQLPPHFAPNRLNELLDFLDKCSIQNLAIELRHPQWFTEKLALNTLSNYLYKNNMSLVLTDTPTRRDVLHMRITNKTAFIRFNANDKHASDYIRINEWIARLYEWLQMGLENIYFFIHTPTQTNMPELVTYFIQQLKKECGITLNPPKIKTIEMDNKLF
jgi:uncharacterized protein YecE (DUF72 family)